MLFNSIDFAVFLPIVFFLFWLLKEPKKQNVLLLLSSYLFYGWWDWRFLILIAFSSLVDYYTGLSIHSATSQKRKKVLLFLSLSVNLGFLGFFKYFNFFVESFSEAFSLLGNEFSIDRLNIILPVGISFYTFQTLSYTIDIYREKLKPTKKAISFFTYVSFFPQLVAGPIERAKNLLPQFDKVKTFNYSNAVEGMRQILWGLIKKVIIADNCALFANLIFSSPEEHSGSTLFLGAFFFAFQIYGDFSGYSDIAIGTARLFGFKLMTNFSYPYFSRDIAEFWRKWHISLTTWFRDYVYIPIGGSRGNSYQTIRNTIIIFLVSGLWHGANWTFILWGLVNAIYFIPILIMERNRKHTDIVAENKILPSGIELVKMLSTFILTIFAWIFFRAENVSELVVILSNVFSRTLFDVPYFSGIGRTVSLLPMIFIFLVIEWLGRKEEFALGKLEKRLMKPIRWMLYYLLALSVYLFAAEQQEFIYFQF